MNLRSLLGEVAANVTAGFVEEMSEAIKREARELPCHPSARAIGHKLATELLGGSTINGLREYPLEIDGQPVELTPESLSVLLKHPAKARHL